MDLIEHTKKQVEFSQKTFGKGETTESVIERIKQKLEEVKACPEDLYGWVDIMMLAIDGATRQGWSADRIAQALPDKLAINQRRAWPDWQSGAGACKRCP